MSREVQAFLLESMAKLADSAGNIAWAGRTEVLYQTAAQHFLWLTPDPVYDEVWRDDRPNDKNRIKLEGQLFKPDALGIHAAGRALEGGRHASIWVTRAALSEGIQKCLDQEISRLANKEREKNRISSVGRLLENSNFLQNYLNLFNSLYYASAGRGNTLIHYLMNEGETDSDISVLHFDASLIGDGDSRVVQRDMQFTIDATDLQVVVPNAQQRTFKLTEHVLSRKQLDVLADAAVRSHWAAELAVVLAETSFAWQRILTQAELSMLTGQLRHRLDQGSTSSVSWPRFDVLGEAWELFREGWFGTANAAQGSEAKRSTDRKLALLRHFLLYGAFCGRHFYVVRLPSDPQFHVCCTVGLPEPLDDKELKQVVAICEGLRTNLARMLKASAQRPDEQKLKLQLSSILGDNVEAAMNNQLSVASNSRLTEMVHGLDRYLQFAMELAEIAIHEGKRLSFDFLVGDGLTASKNLDKVSLLPVISLDGNKGFWNELPEGNHLEARRRRQALGSLLLGNYSFLKRPAVLFGDHEGRLLWLARLLESSRAPEAATNEKGCYLIRVQANGDIRVFCQSKLVLWRHAGAFLVPRLYGTEYEAVLARFLSQKFSSTHPVIDFVLLAQVVWQLSQDMEGGACFVLGRFENGGFPLQKHTAALTHVLPFAEGLPLVRPGNEEVLKQLAVQDGATLIDTDTGNVYGRRQLLAAGLPEKGDYLGDAVKALRAESPQHWHKLLRWGTRHHSAFAFSRSAYARMAVEGPPNASVVVITVSQDGDIHVLVDGKLENDLVYPSSHEVDDVGPRQPAHSVG